LDEQYKAARILYFDSFPMTGNGRKVSMIKFKSCRVQINISYNKIIDFKTYSALIISTFQLSYNISTYDILYDIIYHIIYHKLYKVYVIAYSVS